MIRIGDSVSTTKEECEAQIRAWQSETPSMSDMKFDGIEVKHLSTKSKIIMGKCRCWKFGDGEIRYNIFLAPKTLSLPSKCLNAVLWHEFCHAWDYWENRGMDSHGKRFYSYFLSRKWVWFWDLVAKFSFVFVRN